MRIVWIYGRRLVEGLLLFAIGHGIILFLATIGIFPDRFVAAVITTATEAPVWANWLMAGAFGLLGTFILERFVWGRHSSSARGVVLLRNALAIRDADAKIREADQAIMRTAMRLLEGSYPNEAAWATDYAVWEPAMRRIDSLVPQWAPQPHVPFLDLKYLERGAPSPPLQSNIKSDTNTMRYKAVWVAQRSYSNRREEILRFFSSKTGELPK
jgi:hypothetical protein